MHLIWFEALFWGFFESPLGTGQILQIYLTIANVQSLFVGPLRAMAPLASSHVGRDDAVWQTSKHTWSMSLLYLASGNEIKRKAEEKERLRHGETRSEWWSEEESNWKRAQTERMGASHFESLAQRSGCSLSRIMIRSMRLLMERFVTTSCSSAPTQSRVSPAWLQGGPSNGNWVAQISTSTFSRSVFDQPKNSIDLITNQRESFSRHGKREAEAPSCSENPGPRRRNYLFVVNSACCWRDQQRCWCCYTGSFIRIGWKKKKLKNSTEDIFF